MIYSYCACMDKYGTDYNLKKAVNDGTLFQIEKGIYADRDRVSELELVMFKYPNAILTLDSAFYYHGLTDVIPDKYILNTGRNASKIRNKKIKQYFCSEALLDIGKTQMDHQGVDIRIYDLERLMIELIKYRSKLPYDYYKEIVRSYRERVYDIDTEKLQEYLPMFPARVKIQSIIEEEIF